MRMKKLFAGVCILLSSAAPLLAQENDPAVTPDNVDKLEASRPIMEYALAGGFLLGALAIGFMPSKRTKES